MSVLLTLRQKNRDLPRLAFSPGEKTQQTAHMPEGRARYTCRACVR
jgi:hypothetical protein